MRASILYADRICQQFLTMASPKRAEHKVQMNKVANHCCVYAGIIKKTNKRGLATDPKLT